MIPVTLRTERLVLDQPTAADVDVITEYCQDPIFEAYLTTPWPYTRADAEQFVETHVPNGWSEGTEEALGEVADWWFASFGRVALHWECVVGNIASAATARATGFTYTGRRPAEVPDRDGSRPEAWHGVLHSSDPRTPKGGWPL
jgi:RimJ/RimL family protein N-acetyltransferase